MKWLMAPDSYKGSLSAVQVAEVMVQAVRDELPGAEAIGLPLADGGEGTVDALVTAGGGEKRFVEVTGPLGLPVRSYYGTIGRTAVLEAANLFGLPMVPEADRDPLCTTSAGLGDAIRAALDADFAEFIIGLGGSSTNDGGIGMLRALGVIFLDHSGNPLHGYGADLAEIASVDFTGLDPRLAAARITVACDVINPLLGEAGATFVYGPQKGASPELCRRLDEAMAAYADKVEEGRASMRNEPGAGAAGGLGFALLTLGAKLMPGAEVLEAYVGLREKIRDADWVITGEGRSDGQTLYGKLPLHIAQLARESGTKAILLSGSLGPDSERLAPYFAGCFSIAEGPATLAECMENAEAALYRSTRHLARLIATASG
ncbi:glycerate kinase family protein [Paenibacillus sp. YIM B09110]|uniref:glycerate kinase family protein n=1 Tax=Paenibacillus sp. YIM B09110 TaxID=3126102 RepID=UPI00301E1E37